MVISTYLHDPVVHLTSLFALALLLGSAALHKIRDRQGFARALDSYAIALPGLLPGWFRSVLTRLLPWLELMTAVGLLLCVWSAWAALPAVLLLALYTGVLWVSVLRGTPMEDCGCHFGDKPQAPGMALVWRNLLFLLPAINLMSPMLNRPSVWLDVFTASGLLLSSVAIYLLANLLISNRQYLREL